MNGENVFVGFLVGTVVAAGIVLGLFEGFAAAVGRLEVETAADGRTVRQYEGDLDKPAVGINVLSSLESEWLHSRSY